jgi:hypothetical protein
MEKTKSDPSEINNFDRLHKKIVDYLSSGEVHSTLVGIIINLDGDKGEKDVIEATVFADYIINFLKKVD